ncbi:hypothetical protein KAR91_77330 [Candidatus Pacearchaeota archaeon]|nr:hypothetical protein [Candidatus Pacearchaeota archaeon]
MVEISEYYATEAVKEISKGYIKGGLTALKKEFPDAYSKMEKKLERNFTKSGVDKYVEDLIRGLEAVNSWRIKKDISK